MFTFSPYAPRNRAYLACDHPSSVALLDLNRLTREARRSRWVGATGSLEPGNLPRRSLNLPGATRLTLDGAGASWARLLTYPERLTEALDRVADSAAKLGVAQPLVLVLVRLDAPNLTEVGAALTEFHDRQRNCTLLPLVVGGAPDANHQRIEQNAGLIEALHREEVIPVALRLNTASHAGVGLLVQQRAELTSLLQLLLHRPLPTVEQSLQPNVPALLADLGRRGPWATGMVAIASVPEDPIHPLIRFIRTVLRRLMALFPARAWSGRELFRTLPPRMWGGHQGAAMVSQALASAASVGLRTAAGPTRPAFVALPLAPGDRRWPQVAEELTRLLADDGLGPLALVSGNGLATIRSREPYLLQVTAFESHQTLPDLAQLGATVHLAPPVDRDSVTANGHRPFAAVPLA